MNIASPENAACFCSRGARDSLVYRTDLYMKLHTELGRLCGSKELIEIARRNEDGYQMSSG